MIPAEVVGTPERIHPSGQHRFCVDDGAPSARQGRQGAHSSGCVESAIRRVINLRLKAPGTFWTQDMAEYFLFLRSQLLSGRWDTFIHNVARLTRQWIEPLPQLNNLEELYELPQAA
jgi:hypothetical protein